MENPTCGIAFGEVYHTAGGVTDIICAIAGASFVNQA